MMLIRIPRVSVNESQISESFRIGFSFCWHCVSHGTWAMCSSWLTVVLDVEIWFSRAWDIQSCSNDAETENETELLIGMRVKPIQNTETITRELSSLSLSYSLFSRSLFLSCRSFARDIKTRANDQRMLLKYFFSKWDGLLSGVEDRKKLSNWSINLN